MKMLISQIGTMTQTRMGWGWVKLQPIRGQKVFLWQNLEVFVIFLFSIFISGDSASYFLGMIMLILDTLAQTRVGVGR